MGYLTTLYWRCNVLPMLSLTRRQLQNLQVATHARVQAALMAGRKYRENPMLAAHEAKKQADAAVKVNQRTTK